ncbi:MAG: SDR family oxidoreductase [Proteobacteria bacterium]|nr:SDR family oxidoreductase [Pseudomonadota bacterium]
MQFEGKVAIVTGAGGEIGAAYAEGIAAEGAAVVVADLDEAGGRKTVDSIRAAGGEAHFVRVDIGSSESTEALARATVETCGGIDFLVNNAAFFNDLRHEPLIECDFDYYLKVFDINLHGALRCVRACYPSMRERGGGSIVNQSSTASWMAAGYYGLTKLGINGLTRDLAHELGPMGIRVNAIAPGPTDTRALRSGAPDEILDALVGQMAIRHLGHPRDLVGTCLFLLSDASAWMSGQILTVDGGQTLRV